MSKRKWIGAGVGLFTVAFVAVWLLRPSSHEGDSSEAAGQPPVEQTPAALESDQKILATLNAQPLARPKTPPNSDPDQLAKVDAEWNDLHDFLVEAILSRPQPAMPIGTRVTRRAREFTPVVDIEVRMPRPDKRAIRQVVLNCAYALGGAENSGKSWFVAFAKIITPRGFAEIPIVSPPAKVMAAEAWKDNPNPDVLKRLEENVLAQGHWEDSVKWLFED